MSTEIADESDLRRRLEQRLALRQTHPAHAAARRFEPQSGLARGAPVDRVLRPAAVLIPIIERARVLAACCSRGAPIIWRGTRGK